DVLFTSLKSQNVRALTTVVEACARDPPREAALKGLGGSDEPKVGPSKAQPSAKVLTLADGDVRTVFAGRSQDSKGNRVDDRHEKSALLMRLVSHFFHRNH